jgi:hypothetical protein
MLKKTPPPKAPLYLNTPNQNIPIPTSSAPQIGSPEHSVVRPWPMPTQYRRNELALATTTATPITGTP